MKAFSYLIGGVSAAATAFYLVVYLYRWQWNRALICGVLLVAIEVLLLGAVVLGRIARLERRLDADDRNAGSAGPGPGIGVWPGEKTAGNGRAPAHESFRWLDSRELGGTTTHHVFIPVLLGLGVMLSALSWIVQRAARITVRPMSERRLSGRLGALMLPESGTGGRLEDEPAIPAPRRLRTLGIAAVVVTVGVGVTAGVDVLGDATQTRPQAAPNSAATTLVMRVETRAPSDDAGYAHAARALWEKCHQGSTAARLDGASLISLGHDVFAVVVRPALTDNDLTRLRGCLLDAKADGIQGRILGEGQARPAPWLP